MKAANDHAALALSRRDYWLERAEHHLGLGEGAADSRASWSHFQLAGRYLDRAYGGGQTEHGWESGAVALRAIQ